MGTISQLIEQNANSANINRPHWTPTWGWLCYLVMIDDRITEQEWGDGPYQPGLIAIAIKRSDHRPVQFHEFILGRFNAGGKFVAGLSPRVSDFKLNPSIDEKAWKDASRLLAFAQEWQSENLAYQHDEWIVKNGGERGDKPAKVTGKTEKARLKGKAKPKK